MTKKSKYFALGILTSFLLGVGTAHAVPVGTVLTYDFTGNDTGPPNPNPLGLAVGDLGTNTINVADPLFGVSVVITGFDADVDNNETALNHDHLQRNGPNGLGIFGDEQNNRIGTDEAVQFDFSPIVALGVSSVIFEGGSGIGSFDVFVDNVFAETINFNVGGSTHVNHLFSSAPVGSIFEFRGVKNGFRIVELTVQVVPEPSTMLLFGTGVLGLIGYMRRQKGTSGA